MPGAEARGAALRWRAAAFQGSSALLYAKVGFARLYTEKTPIAAADLLNARVLPFFEQHGIPACRVLTDRGTEYCGVADRHPYELYLTLEDIDHTRTKTKSPQTSGICERFNKTLLNEPYRVSAAGLSECGRPATGSRQVR